MLFFPMFPFHTFFCYISATSSICCYNNLFLIVYCIQFSLCFFLELLLRVVSFCSLVRNFTFTYVLTNSYFSVIWHHSMAVQLGKYSGSLRVCAQKYDLSSHVRENIFTVRKKVFLPKYIYLICLKTII